MPQAHQPGQSAFRSILPEAIDWKPFPAFPPSVRLAVLVGEPSKSGPYMVRVKVPAGVKLMPHQASGRPHLHGHIRRLLHRAWQPLRWRSNEPLSAG